MKIARIVVACAVAACGSAAAQKECTKAEAAAAEKVTERIVNYAQLNKAYKDFLGVGYAEACAYDWRKILHPGDLTRIVAESQAGEASLEPFSLEARYRRAGDPDWRWMRSTSQPRWGPMGEHVGFTGVAHDITEAKQAQADLLRINELLEERVARIASPSRVSARRS